MVALLVGMQAVVYILGGLKVAAMSPAVHQEYTTDSGDDSIHFAVGVLKQFFAKRNKGE